MCGIFSLLQNGVELSYKYIDTEFQKGKGRGPENSKLEMRENIVFGFHRLAINGLNDESNQPIIINNITLICNGEIYNYKKLYEDLGIEPYTQSDCEIILHLYSKYGIEQTLNMLDGVFAFVLYDDRDPYTKKCFVARDPFGIRPLYQLIYKNRSNENDNIVIGFASELKMLEQFYNKQRDISILGHFQPSTYSTFELNKRDNNCKWEEIMRHKLYFTLKPVQSSNINNFVTKYIEQHISHLLNSVVVKRCVTTERKVACLLSGGLDSSLIAALISNYFRGRGSKIETFSIGLAGSEDLKYAKIAASYIGSVHTEIIVTEDEMFSAIPHVIKALETYDTTTVRASIGNYLIGKYISQHSDAKVVFNGDGSDELFGGYLYMNACPNNDEFDKETRRLLSDIYMFDVLRSDKCISSHGLEPRTPFLDKSFVDYVVSLPVDFRNHNHFNKQIEKRLLRNAFTKDIFKDNLGRQILPDEILFRKKEAFSDGVSSHTKSLFQILQEKISSHLNRLYNNNNDKYYPNIETEKFYYKKVFDDFYPNCRHIMAYYWMPKYTHSLDPSARTLEYYNQNVHVIHEMTNTKVV